jgi:hypothetical protein
VTKIPPEHTAARALEDSFRELGEQRARARPPRRRATRHVPRVVLIALTVLLLVAVAATGTKLFLDDDGTVKSDPKGPRHHVEPAPSHRQVALASAADPAERLPWGLQLSENAAGDTCLALGRIVGGRPGALRSGRFQELPARAGGLCGPLEDRHVVVATRSFPDSAIPGSRGVLFGIVDRTVTRLQLRSATGARSPIAVQADGTFVVVRRGQDAFRGAQLVLEGSTGRRAVLLRP